MSNAYKPLAGVKVLELSTMMAAPCCGRYLADWGAEVIKVEPLTGEAGRLTGLTLRLRADEQQNPHADGKDGGKRSLPINMKDPRGVEIMDKLLSEANIFISNYRPKALTKLGLDYEQMSARHPHIIWGCLTGFGLEGPIANNPGYDTVAFWARSGAMIDLCDNGDIPLTPPFALGDYELSDPVETDYGYHILLGLPLEPDGLTMDQDANTGEYMTLRQTAANELFNRQLVEWIDSAQVEWAEGYEDLDFNALFHGE